MTLSGFALFLGDLKNADPNCVRGLFISARGQSACEVLRDAYGEARATFSASSEGGRFGDSLAPGFLRFLKEDNFAKISAAFVDDVTKLTCDTNLEGLLWKRLRPGPFLSDRWLLQAASRRVHERFPNSPFGRFFSSRHSLCLGIPPDIAHEKSEAFLDLVAVTAPLIQGAAHFAGQGGAFEIAENLFQWAFLGHEWSGTPVSKRDQVAFIDLHERIGRAVTVERLRILQGPQNEASYRRWENHLKKLEAQTDRVFQAFRDLTSPYQNRINDFKRLRGCLRNLETEMVGEGELRALFTRHRMVLASCDPMEKAPWDMQEQEGVEGKSILLSRDICLPAGNPDAFEFGLRALLTRRFEEDCIYRLERNPVALPPPLETLEGSWRRIQARVRALDFHVATVDCILRSWEALPWENLIIFWNSQVSCLNDCVDRAERGAGNQALCMKISEALSVVEYVRHWLWTYYPDHVSNPPRDVTATKDQVLKVSGRLWGALVDVLAKIRTSADKIEIFIRKEKEIFRRLESEMPETSLMLQLQEALARGNWKAAETAFASWIEGELPDSERKRSLIARILDENGPMRPGIDRHLESSVEGKKGFVKFLDTVWESSPADIDLALWANRLDEALGRIESAYGRALRMKKRLPRSPVIEDLLNSLAPQVIYRT